jgi:hypothetical protein
MMPVMVVSPTKMTTAGRNSRARSENMTNSP